MTADRETMTVTADSATSPPVERRAGRPLHTFHWTELGNAERLVARHGDDLRFCHLWERWFVWDGVRWKPDETREVVRLCIQTVKAMYADLELIPDEDDQKKFFTFIRQSAKRPALRNMQDLAASDEAIGVTPDQLDADPMLLAVANGTVDLRTGEHRSSRRSDLLTRQSPVEWSAGARAPAWERFLADVVPDPELRAYIQRAVGYSLTGVTTEHVFFMAYGNGANGKSTFFKVIEEVLGSYAQSVAADTLIEKRHGGGIPNDIARMAGARFVAGVETGDGQRLNEPLVKQLTAGDTIPARFMRAEFFEFTPQLKLWIATNHRPTIKGTDDGIWRRVHLVPFVVSFPPERQDHELSNKLKEELPGILNWAIEGCLAWQREKLNPPEIVRVATEEYREDMDVLATFLAERCVAGPDLFVSNERLYAEYVAWCTANGHRPFARPALLRQLCEREGGQFTKGRKREHGADSSRPNGVLGLGLQPAFGSAARSSKIRIASVTEIGGGTTA